MAKTITIRTAVWTTACLCIAGPALAVDYEGSVRAGVGVSDNIRRSALIEVDETILSAGFTFSAREDTPRTTLSLDAEFDYFDYGDETFAGEWVGGVNLDASMTLVEEHLRWVFIETFGQQLVDPFEPVRPDNRENVNFLTTGPTLSLLPGGRNQVLLDVRYSEVSFEQRPFDDSRLSATLTLGRDIRRSSNLALNITSERVEYDDPLIPEFDRNQAFLRFSTTGAQSTFRIDLGYNEIDSETTKADGILVEMNWTREVSASGRLTVEGGSQYSDQGNIFRFYQGRGQDLSETIDLFSVPSTFINNYFSANYLIDRERYRVGFGIGWNQEDFRNGLGLDRDNSSAQITVRRNLTRNAWVSLLAKYASREFKYLQRKDDDIVLGVEGGIDLTAGLSVSLEYRHYDRESEFDAEGNFTENRAFLRVNYTPHWSR